MSVGATIAYTIYVPRLGINWLHIKILFTIYFSGEGILFLFFCWIVAAMMRIISKQTEVYAGDKELVSERMDQWQKCSYFLGDLVTHINDCFGFGMLVVYIFISIRMINGCYNLVNELKLVADPSWFRIFGSFFSIIWPLQCFLFLSYGPHRIKQEVNLYQTSPTSAELLKICFRLFYKDGQFDSQVVPFSIL